MSKKSTLKSWPVALIMIFLIAVLFALALGIVLLSSIRGINILPGWKF